MIPNNNSSLLQDNSGPAQLRKRKKNKMAYTLTILISTTAQTMKMKIRMRMMTLLASKMAAARTHSRLLPALARTRRLPRGIFRSRLRLRMRKKRRRAMIRTSKESPCQVGGARTIKRTLMKARKKKNRKKKRMKRKRIAIHCGAIKLTQGDHSHKCSSLLGAMLLFNSKFPSRYPDHSSNSKGFPSRCKIIKRQVLSN